jgi:hypothetical protein
MTGIIAVDIFLFSAEHITISSAIVIKKPVRLAKASINSSRLDKASVYLLFLLIMTRKMINRLRKSTKLYI